MPRNPVYSNHPRYLKFQNFPSWIIISYLCNLGRLYATKILWFTSRKSQSRKYFLRWSAQILPTGTLLLATFDSFIHEPRHYQVNHCYSSSFPADASRRSHLRSHVTAWFQFYFHNFNSKSMAMLVFQNRMKGIISLVESAELGWWTNHIKCYLNLGSKFMIWWRKDIVFRKHNQNIYHILPMKTGIKVAFYLLK